jgi:hypothetical protein
MPDTVTAEVEAAMQLLGFIFEPGDLIEFRTIGTKPSQHWAMLQDASTCINLLQAYPAGTHVYFGANPRRERGGKAEHVGLARCLFADFDGGVGVEEARRRWTEALIPEPTVIVSTGGGVHAWWRLLEPMEDLKAWTARQKALAIRLGSDQAVTDAPRIMRLPGFRNWKYHHQPLCVVEACEPDNVYDLDEFPDPVQFAAEAPDEHVAPGSLSDLSQRFLHEGFVMRAGRRQTIFTVACDLRAREWDQGDAERAIMKRARLLRLEPDELADVPRQVRNAFKGDRAPCRGRAEDVEVAEEVEPVSQPVGILDLIRANPAMRRPLVHGLLRSGETMNIIAAPKTGKSWMVLDLALCVATGRAWMNTYKVERSKVLLVDNELHEETLAERLQRVAQAMGIPLEELDGWLEVKSLRGALQSFETLDRGMLAPVQPGHYGLVIFDAFYRFNIGDGADENDNSYMASTYNRLDAIAKRLDAALVCIHHTSKGSQAEKAVTDVGSGAGSMSRAADTHLVLREHELEKHLVIDAACRSWAPIEAAVVRFEYPRFYPEPMADPKMLKKARKGKDDGWDVDRFVNEFFPNPAIELSHRDLEASGIEAGLTKNRIRTLKEQAVAKTPRRRPLLERVGDARSTKYRRAS